MWLAVVNVLTFAPAIEILDHSDLGFVGFLTMAMIAFVAVWPLFDKDHRKAHYVLGVLAGIMSQVCVAIVSPWWLVTWMLYVALILLSSYTQYKWLDYTYGKGVFIIEMTCYLTQTGASLV